MNLSWKNLTLFSRNTTKTKFSACWEEQKRNHNFKIRLLWAGLSCSKAKHWAHPHQEHPTASTPSFAPSFFPFVHVNTCNVMITQTADSIKMWGFGKSFKVPISHTAVFGQTDPSTESHSVKYWGFPLAMNYLGCNFKKKYLHIS